MDAISFLLSSIILFIFLMWGFLVFDLTLAQKIFYPLGLLFYIAVKAHMGKDLQTNATRVDFNGASKGGIIKCDASET